MGRVGVVVEDGGITSDCAGAGDFASVGGGDVVFGAEAEDSQYFDELNSTTGAKEAVDLVSTDGGGIAS